MIKFSWSKKTSTEANSLWHETFNELQKVRREYIQLLEENSQLLKENQELRKKLKND